MALAFDDFIGAGRKIGHRLMSNATREAPYLSKRSFRLPKTFHGMSAVHVGEDLTPEEMGHLDTAVGRMQQMYPEAHQSIKSLFLANRGRVGEDRLSSMPKFFRNNLRQFMNSMGGTNLGPLVDDLDTYDDPRVSVIGLNNANISHHRKLGALPISNAVLDKNGLVGDNALGRVYTHEFMHVRHNEITNVHSAVTDLSYPDEVYDKVMDYHENLIAGMNTQIDQATGGRLSIAGKINPELTDRVLGSNYAGTLPGELTPEVSVMRHYDSPLYTPKLEMAMRNIDDDISQIRANTTMRSGARPRSRSAMGGIAYLQ